MTTQTLTRPQQVADFTVSRSAVTMGVLACLAVAGAAAGVARLLLGMGETTALTDATPWGIWIGFDFALIAFSGAAFTLAALVHVFHMERFHAALRPALFAGLLGYVAVLLLLVLDLGRPDRFYNFMLYFNLHSPLFEICWCVLLYSTVLVLEVAPDIFNRFGWSRATRMTKFIMPVVSILGVTLSSLHQSTLGTLYLNMPHRLGPLWWTPMLPVLFFTSAVMAGLSLAMLAYRAAVRMHHTQEDRRLLTGLGRGVAGVLVVYLAMRLGALFFNDGWQALTAGGANPWLFAIEVGIGAVVPLVLLALFGRGFRSWPYWTAPALVLFGVLMNRFNAAVFAQHSPLPDVAYLPSVIEWLSTIGIVAGAGLVWMIAIRWFVRFEHHGSPAHQEA